MQPNTHTTDQTNDQATVSWRDFHAQHLQRQTKALESIRGYVSAVVWIAVAAAVLLLFAVMGAALG